MVKLKSKKKYDLTSKLAENEYLLRVNSFGDTGYLSKLNKDGSINKNFIKWDNFGYSHGSFGPLHDVSELDIMVHEENFNEGWGFVDFRAGKSHSWVVLKHPLGFNLEIYLEEFNKLVPKITIINGNLQGKFKWEYGRLIME